jgi:hypothetical protein
MTITKCECELAGHCNRHNVSKTKHHVKLCQERPEFFQAWENGTGPGQKWSQSDKDARSNIDATRAMIDGTLAEAGRKCWDALFSGVFTLADLEAWEKTIPKFGCNCTGFYKDWKANNPVTPDFTDEVDFAWKYRLKKAVNEKLGHKQATSNEARDERMTVKRVSAYWHSIGKLPPLQSYLRAVEWHHQSITPTKPRCVVVLAPDDWTKSQLAITRKGFQRYAAKCDADYIELTHDAYSAWPMANKLIQIPQVTTYYDQTVYFDCDVIAKATMPNLFQQVPRHYYAAQDELPTILKLKCEGHYFQHFPNLLAVDKVPNGGVLVLPRNAAAYTVPNESMAEDWCVDQFVLATQLPAANTVWLDDRYNWGWIRKDWQEGLDNAYAIHLNGAVPEDRMKWLRKLTDRYQRTESG